MGRPTTWVWVLALALSGPSPALVAQAETELEGIVRRLEGDCPNLMFVADGISVSTDDGTNFDGMDCTDIANGVEVEVEGTGGATGVVRAAEVELDDPDEADDDDEQDDDDSR